MVKDAGVIFNGVCQVWLESWGRGTGGKEVWLRWVYELRAREMTSYFPARVV